MNETNQQPQRCEHPSCEHDRTLGRPTACEFDAVKSLEFLMHDGPSGTVAPVYLHPLLRKIRDEIVTLRIENETLAEANRWYSEVSEREWDGRK